MKESKKIMMAVIFLLVSLTLILALTGANNQHGLDLQNNDCFIMGYNAQIVKDHKIYCCDVNDGEQIINCTKQG